MNMKITLLAINVLIGSLYLGFPPIYGVVGFNAIFWIGLIYDLATSTEDKIVDKLLTKRKAARPTSEQIAFERFLVRNFVESNFTDTELPNSEIPSIEQRIVPAIEA
ncbi:MAG: hypothetical protein ACW98F_04710 [Candidatus Hodarchaeales archaeon]